MKLAEFMGLYCTIFCDLVSHRLQKYSNMFGYLFAHFKGRVSQKSNFECIAFGQKQWNTSRFYIFPKPPFKLFILLFSQCETSFWLTDFFLVLDVSLVSGTECLCTGNLVKSSSDVTAARTLVIFARFYHTDKAEATHTVQ